MHFFIFLNIEVTIDRYKKQEYNTYILI